MSSLNGAAHFPDDVVELTQTLVRIPSENPIGDEVAVAEYISYWLKTHGIGVETQAVDNKRFNVFGKLKGEGSSPPLVYLAHMDTVPIGERERWTHDPFGGEIVDGKLYGRCSCDMKGGTAGAMIALKRLLDSGAELSGDVILACTVDEESGMTGSSAMALEKDKWAEAYLLTMEPTDCKLNVAHKGAFWFQAIMRGRGAHAANPQFGADANRAMAKAMLAWYELTEKTLKKELKEHPLLGYPTLIVSKIDGGVKTNIVSEYCHAEMDMRVPPTIEAKQIIEYVEGIGKQAAAEYGVSFELIVPKELRLPVECRADSPLISAFDRAYQGVTSQAAVHEGFLAYTDAATLAVKTGNQHSTVFGPGLLSDAHTTDEKVEVSQLYLTTDVLEKTALELLG